MLKKLHLALLALIFSISTLYQVAHAADARMTDRTMGNPSAKVKIVEYSSLTCPHCALFDADTLPQLKKDYIDTGKVYFVSRDFPLDAPALKAAMMARCAPVDQYFALIDLLFKTQLTWGLAPDPDAAIMQQGKMAGLSEAAVKACFDDKALQDFVVGERQEGTDRFKVQSTPTFVFNSGAEQFSGSQPYEKFKTTIDSLLAR